MNYEDEKRVRAIVEDMRPQMGCADSVAMLLCIATFVGMIFSNILLWQWQQQREPQLHRIFDVTVEPEQRP